MQALGVGMSAVTGTFKATVSALVPKPNGDGLVFWLQSENFVPWG